MCIYVYTFISIIVYLTHHSSPARFHYSGMSVYKYIWYKHMYMYTYISLASRGPLIQLLYVYILVYICMFMMVYFAQHSSLLLLHLWGSPSILTLSHSHSYRVVWCMCMCMCGCGCGCGCATYQIAYGFSLPLPLQIIFMPVYMLEFIITHAICTV